jgi:hypothetical protein
MAHMRRGRKGRRRVAPGKRQYSYRLAHVGMVLKSQEQVTNLYNSPSVGKNVLPPYYHQSKMNKSDWICYLGRYSVCCLTTYGAIVIVSVVFSGSFASSVIR